MLKIITDSASDMPQHIVERFNLHVIPTPVVIDGVDYLDGATIHTKEFYELLDDVSRDIKTYHINPSMFEEAFRPYAEHNDSVIYLCFSTGIAGTFNAANIAKQNILEDYPDFDLTIVDSKSAAIGFGLIVYKLLLLQEAGADKEKLLRAANFYVNHIQHVFTVSTLRYLIKGGRLSKWKGTAGELLDMKPVLIVDKDGSLQVLKNHPRPQKIPKSPDRICTGKHCRPVPSDHGHLPRGRSRFPAVYQRPSAAGHFSKGAGRIYHRLRHRCAHRTRHHRHRVLRCDE